MALGTTGFDANEETVAARDYVSVTDQTASVSTPKVRLGGACLALIVLLGFGLRLAALSWGQAYAYGSQGDCIDAYKVAVDYLTGDEKARYLGQPNFSHHAKLPGPLWTLFVVAGLRMGNSLETVAALLMLLSTAAIYFTYLLVARTVGVPAALWAALLMATSPEAINSSVLVFNPTIMQFLGALLFLALWPATQRDHARAIFWVPFLLLTMLQFHMSGLMLIPAIVVVSFLSKKRLNWGWLIGGLLCGLCLYLPYVQGEARHGWQNTRGMFMGEPLTHMADALKAFSAPFHFLVNYWAPGWTYTREEWRAMCRACFGSVGLCLAINAVSFLLAALLGIGAALRIREASRGLLRSPAAVFARSPGIVFLITIFTIPLVVSLVLRRPFHPRYCLVLLAPLFSLAGLGVVKCLALPSFRGIFSSVLIFTIAANIWFVPAMYLFQERHIEHAGRFVPTFRKLERVYQTLRADAGGSRAVMVDDERYLQSLSPGDKLNFNIRVLQQYVGSRERQLRHPRKSFSIYILFPASEVKPGTAGVAYNANGIALVAKPLAD